MATDTKIGEYSENRRILAHMSLPLSFVNNDNISEGNLYKDTLHLLEAGKSILGNNFINGINNNNFLLKYREDNHL